MPPSLTQPLTMRTFGMNTQVRYLDDVAKASATFKTQNTQTLASLVWEFFEFWAWKHSYPHDVISIRNGRVISKASKDWTKRIGRDRHLVCVEDPFVLSHDLGRTVDMKSKDVIRKEFFRAGTILRDYEECFEMLFEEYSSRRPSSGHHGGRHRSMPPRSGQPRGKDKPRGVFVK
jgi:DNA polymerase sigma